ncbi:hypothetical protein SprV_0301179700 [Sparganum proliferum]
MDMLNDFVAAIGRRRFTAFSELRDAVESFNERMDAKFRIFRSHKLPPGHQHANTITYRSVHYACRYSNSEGCQASFLLSYFNGYLICKHMNLAHNHMSITVREVSDSLATDYKIVTDLTEDFKRRFPNRIFASFTDLTSRLNEYEQETGSMFVKKHVKHWEADSGHRSTLVYKTLAFHCIHHGQPSSVARTFAFSGSMKMGCRAKLYVSSMSGQVRIKSINLRHNHEVSPQLASTYNRNLRLSNEEQNLIESLSTTNLTPSRISDLLIKKTHRHLPPQTVRKMVYRARRHLSSGSQGQHQKEHASADTDTSAKCADFIWHYGDDSDNQQSSLPLLCTPSEVDANEQKAHLLLNGSCVKAEQCGNGPELKCELVTRGEYEQEASESAPVRCSAPGTSTGRCPSTSVASLNWISRHETCAVPSDVQTLTEALDGRRPCSTGVPVGPPPSTSSEMHLARLTLNCPSDTEWKFRARGTNLAGLNEVLRQATFEDIVKLAGPKLARGMTLWNFFRLRYRNSDSSSMPIPTMVEEYLHLVKCFQTFLADRLRPLAANSGTSASMSRGPSVAFSDTPVLGKARLKGQEELVAGPTRELPAEFGLLSPSVGEGARLVSPTSTSVRPADIVISTAEHSTALGLPIGRYVLRRPTSSPNLRSPCRARIKETTGLQNQPRFPVPEDAMLHLSHKGCRTCQLYPPNRPCHYRLCAESLGEAIPAELIASGVFLPYLPKSDSSSAHLHDLVMEAANGRIFHRLSGRLVMPASEPSALSADSSASTEHTRDGNVGADIGVLEEEGVETEEDLTEIGSPIVIEAPPGADDTTCTSIAADVAARGVAHQPSATTTTRLTLMRLPTSPTASLVIRPDGAVFRVEHGEEDVTKASMRAILRFEG